MGKNPDVVVVGLGAMGAAITYQVAKCGLEVVGIDQFSPPHDRGSTHGETRITRCGVGEGLQFVPLAQRSQELWREIEKESGYEIFSQIGGLIFARTGQTSRLHGQIDFLRATINAADTFRIDHEILDAAAIAERFPQFELSGDERGYFEPQAGYLNPENGVAAQLRLAEANGAQLLKGSAAVLRSEHDEAVVECGGTKYRAGTVVAAAGAWTPQLLPQLERRLTVTRQTLFWFALDGSVSYSNDDFPIYIWHAGGGEDKHFYGFPQVGERPEIKVATEQHVETTTPESVEREVNPAEIEAMFERHIEGRLRGVTSNCVRAVTCLYTSTQDSGFLIDRLPGRENVVLVSACSGHGFKHSAAIGEAVAEMVETGVKPEVLKPFSLDV